MVLLVVSFNVRHMLWTSRQTSAAPQRVSLSIHKIRPTDTGLQLYHFLLDVANSNKVASKYRHVRDFSAGNGGVR